MPRADFRIKGDALDPLAPVKVLAVMCHPSDARGREVILRRIPEKITVSRYQRAQGYSDEPWFREIWAEFRKHRQSGALAGALALALGQQSIAGRSGMADFVMQLATSIAVEWIQVVDLEAETQFGLQSALPSEAQIASAFHRYRGVCHLWAALVYGRLKYRQNITPLSTQTLPTFLAFAEEIARLATASGWPREEPATTLTADALWSFILPEAVRKTATTQTVQPPSGHVVEPAPAEYAPVSTEGL